MVVESRYPMATIGKHQNGQQSDCDENFDSVTPNWLRIFEGASCTVIHAAGKQHASSNRSASALRNLKTLARIGVADAASAEAGGHHQIAVLLPMARNSSRFSATHLATAQ
jgi:hypothetical protein